MAKQNNQAPVAEVIADEAPEVIAAVDPAEEVAELNPPASDVLDIEKAGEESADDDGLVEVFKGRDNLRVHPTCVDEHKRLGWTEA